MNQLLLAGVFFASSACGALAEPITYKFVVQGGMATVRVRARASHRVHSHAGWRADCHGR